MIKEKVFPVRSLALRIVCIFGIAVCEITLLFNLFLAVDLSVVRGSCKHGSSCENAALGKLHESSLV